MIQKCCMCSSSKDLKEITLGSYYLKNTDDSLTYLTNTYVSNYVRTDKCEYGVCIQCYKKRAFQFSIPIILLIIVFLAVLILGIKSNLVKPDENGSFSILVIGWGLLMIAILIIVGSLLSDWNKDFILKLVALPLFEDRQKANKKLISLFSNSKPLKGISDETIKAMQNKDPIILTNAEAAKKFKNSLII